MKSSSGEHYVGLDHVRALAALLVFVWHFIHQGRTPLVEHVENVPPALFPLALFDEGHVGVAVFMVLSGYLFAKLLDGRSILFGRFLLNRALRLIPLLAVVVVIVGAQRISSGESLGDYALKMAEGFVFPRWPNGGWSVTVELHFYLLLPFLLALSKTRAGVLYILAAAVGLRSAIWFQSGEVQSLAYWTIIGRIDQFLLGIAGYRWRHGFAGDHARAAIAGLMLCGGYWWFAEMGGFYGQPSYPSPSPAWVILPTLEGATIAALIAWYDGSFRFGDSGVSGLVAKAGACSYSIYLLHRFFIEWMADFTLAYVLPEPRIYAAMAIALAWFIAFLPVAWVSYRLIELPFLRYRVRYIDETDSRQISARPVTP